MRGRAGPVTEISVAGMKIFPYEHSSPVTGMKLFKQHSSQNGVILVLYVFPL